MIVFALYLRRWGPRVVLIVGTAVVAFSYGILVMLNELPPFDAINAASREPLLSRRAISQPIPHQIRTEHRTPGVVRHDPALAQNGITLMARSRGERFELGLFDMDGNEIHSWRINVVGTLSPKAPLRHEVPMLDGAHLFGNGDVLFVVRYLGLIKLDYCSKVLWFLREPVHHSIAVEPTGTIWVPSRSRVKRGTDAHDRIRTPYWDDMVLKLSAQGEVMQRISVLDAIVGSGYEGLIFGGRPNRPGYHHLNPLQLNDVEVVGPELAERHPALETGDLMLSLRTPNTILFLDPNRNTVRWTIRGPMLRQHDPDIQPDGSIVVFDNRTASSISSRAEYRATEPVFGYSRVLQIDPLTMRPLWVYQGSESDPFYSSVLGGQQVLANGNVLIVESDGGRVFEVDRETSKIVWEFINLLTPDGVVGRVTFAHRLAPEAVPFVSTSCSVIAP